MTIRQELVECLEYAYSLERLDNEASALQQEIAYLHYDENRLQKRKGILCKVGLVCLGFLALLMYVAGAASSTFGIKTVLLEDPEALMMLLLLVFAVLCCGFFWLRTAGNLRRKKQENVLRRKTIDTEIGRTMERMRALVEQARDDGVFDTVPVDYFDSGMLEYCISVIDRKLATTFQEAFLLLEQEINRQQQMQQQQMFFDAQTEQLQLLGRAIQANTILTLMQEQKYKR